MGSIVRDEAVRSGEPRVEGTRITVRDIKRRVIDVDEDPHVVAGEYGISMADLFGALAYYSEGRDAFEGDGRTPSSANSADDQFQLGSWVGVSTEFPLPGLSGLL
jgi:uncharacterized protein (DUF433 family)